MSKISNTKKTFNNANGLIKLLFTVIFMFSSAVSVYANNTELFTDASSSQAALGNVNTEFVIRQRPVNINIISLSEVDTHIELNLFPDRVVTAKLDHLVNLGNDRQAWVGAIEGYENSQVTLVMSNGKLSGSINLPDYSYHIRPIENQLHVIRELDDLALQNSVNQIVEQDLVTESQETQEYQQFQEVPLQLPLDSSFLGTEEQQVLELVNQERAINGLHLIAADPLLTKAARDHSEDMAQNNYFSHTGLNGSAPNQRIAATGYSFNSWGENIAAGYFSAASVMNGWMTSSGHRANILGSQFCDIGIGYAPAGRIWTQTFARKQGVFNCPDVGDTGGPSNPPPPPETGSVLKNGATSNFNLAQNETIQYRIELPANASNLKVSISGTGDADLYVKKTQINWPVDSGQHNNLEFKSPWINGSNEVVTFASPGKATWQVLVHGYAPASGSIKVTWEIKDASGNGGGTDNSNVLQNGTATDFTVARHQVIEYEINVPANAKNLQVKITGSGDADLYVKRSPINWPEDSGRKNLAEFKALWISGSNEAVIFPAPKNGQWHVLIHGYQAAKGRLTALWQ